MAFLPTISKLAIPFAVVNPASDNEFLEKSGRSIPT